MRAEDFIAAAREELGTRFHHQGRLPKVGLDCAGLAVAACRACGEEPADFTNYERTPLRHEFFEALSAQCERVPMGSQRPGDMALFMYAGNPQHLGIFTCVSPDSVIHANQLAGMVVEHRLDGAWKGRLVAIYRVRSMTWQ